MKKLAALMSVLALCLGMIGTGTITARADSVEVKPYIAFGADLTSSQKNKVMELLGDTKEELAHYETITVTNQDEHKNLDSYLDKSVIGTKALSSVKIEEADAGSGVTVTTHNISFVTEEMYTNALVTAGINDATVTVAAPFKISGTAALVGAMKAYETMTGEAVDSDSADAANNELVETSNLAKDVGADKAAEFVASLKEKVVSGDLSSEEDILKAVDETAQEVGITLTDSQKQSMTALMKKISGLDLDTDSLKNQAKDIYNKLKDFDDANGIMDKIKAFFGKIIDFFKNLF